VAALLAAKARNVRPTSVTDPSNFALTRQISHSE
jgi:hypothetical protein